MRGSLIKMRGASISSIRKMENTKKTNQKCKEKVGSSDGRGNAVQERD